MAIDGTYNITVNSPMGKQEGSFTYKTDGSSLTGTATASGETVDIQDGKVSGNDFEHTMKMKTPMGKMKVNVKGTVDGDKISGTFKLPFGAMPFEGTRVQAI